LYRKFRHLSGAAQAFRYVFSIARELFQDLNNQMKLESGIFEMPIAIANCFNISSPLVHWLKGSQVFNPNFKSNRT